VVNELNGENVTRLPAEILELLARVLQAFTFDVVVRRVSQQLVKRNDVARYLMHRIRQESLQRAVLTLWLG
jgi:hypothetical protein